MQEGICYACSLLGHPWLPPEARADSPTLWWQYLLCGSTRLRRHPRGTLVYATEYEPHALLPRQAPPGNTPVHHGDRRHIRFLDGADLIIHDAQYTLDEFPAKAGWGHAPLERVVDYAMLARAKQLALFHHDPTRHDEAVDRLCELASA